LGQTIDKGEGRRLEKKVCQAKEGPSAGLAAAKRDAFLTRKFLALNIFLGKLSELKNAAEKSVFSNSCNLSTISAGLLRLRKKIQLSDEELRLNMHDVLTLFIFQLID
jgi:hypothetical protein